MLSGKVQAPHLTIHCLLPSDPCVSPGLSPFQPPRPPVSWELDPISDCARLIPTSQPLTLLFPLPGLLFQHLFFVTKCILPGPPPLPPRFLQEAPILLSSGLNLSPSSVTLFTLHRSCWSQHLPVPPDSELLTGRAWS